MLYLKEKVVDLQTYIPGCCFSSCAENKICSIADEECGEKIREGHQSFLLGDTGKKKSWCTG